MLASYLVCLVLAVAPAAVPPRTAVVGNLSLRQWNEQVAVGCRRLPTRAQERNCLGRDRIVTNDVSVHDAPARVLSAFENAVEVELKTGSLRGVQKRVDSMVREAFNALGSAATVELVISHSDPRVNWVAARFDARPLSGSLSAVTKTYLVLYTQLLP